MLPSELVALLNQARTNKKVLDVSKLKDKKLKKSRFEDDDDDDEDEEDNDDDDDEDEDGGNSAERPVAESMRLKKASALSSSDESRILKIEALIRVVKTLVEME